MSTVLTSTKSTCIYCDEARPFTAEHMFPAGLGGDDSRFILHDLVCGHCNTKVFSPLETQLMRNSPVALARIFLQPTGRGKGAKATVPVFYPQSNSLIDPETNRACESELSAGGVPVILPQVLFHGNELSLIGPTSEEIDAFLTALSGLLTDDLKYIRKTKTGNVSQFEITHYRWMEANGYRPTGLEILEKPPLGIWHDTLEVPATAEKNHRYGTRLFRRSKGQLVLRVISDDHIELALTNVRIALPQIKATEKPDPHNIEQPGMHLGMKIRMGDVDRAVAKIGVNIACHEYGEAVIRDPAFNSIKTSILTGNQPVRTDTLPDPMLRQIFELDKRDVHLAMLHPIFFNGRSTLIFVIRFYGGGLQIFLLAGDISSPISPEPVIYTVHYNQHRIERQLVEDYLLEVVSLTSNQRSNP